jgi:hypothetical protein
VRVDDGIEGLVHISELAERHVELPEQVVTVGPTSSSRSSTSTSSVAASRCRSSRPTTGAGQVEFDPTLYGMAAEYDEQGNYKYPEGFDPETNEWLEGFEAAREVGEAVRRGPRPLGGPQGAGRGGCQGRRRGCGRGRRRPVVLLLLRRRGRSGHGHARVRRGPGRVAREAHRQLSDAAYRRGMPPAPVHDTTCRTTTAPSTTGAWTCSGPAPTPRCGPG